MKEKYLWRAWPANIGRNVSRCQCRSSTPAGQSEQCAHKPKMSNRKAKPNMQKAGPQAVSLIHVLD